MSDIFESALAKARENDRRNIDATLPTRLTGGSGSKSGRSIFSSALAKARERDRAPKRQLSPSSAGAGGSGVSMSSGANGLEPAAESFGWTSAREAEGALGQWESDLRLMGTQLKNRSERLSSTEKRLAEMQALASAQADIDAYNALVDEYNAELESYRELYDRFEKFASSYDRGYEEYRDILSRQYEEAERLNAEADAVDERNKEVQRLIGQYELALNGAGIAPEQSIEELRREQEANVREAQRLRREAMDAESRYYGSLQLNEDFTEKSAALESQREADILKGLAPYESGGAVYDYINDIGNARQINGYAADGNEYESYATMTADEVAIYNYLYATQGPERAAQFLRDMQETFNQRLGEQRYEGMNGLQRGLYWIPAGLDQFASGLQQLFSSERVPTSATQVTSAKIAEGLENAPVRRTLYELGTTLANMAPSVLTSALLGGTAFAGLGIGSRLAGAGGSALLGASAGGNAYNQALAEIENNIASGEGEYFTPEQARRYAALVGLSEGGLSYLLGGMEKLGGVGAEKIAGKIAGLDNALGRLARSRVGAPALDLAARMVSEGTEEGLQELLEPAFRKLIFDEEYEANFADTAYAFLLGALSAGMVEGPGAVSSAIRGSAAETTEAQMPVPDAAEAAAEAMPPAMLNFAEVDGYLGPDVQNYFEGITTPEALEARYIEMAENDTEGTLDWDNIYRQYIMARAYLEGREAVGAEPAQAAPMGAQTAESATDAAADGGLVLPTAEELERRKRAENAATELERSGILAGVSDENIASAQRMSSALGREIQFYDGAEQSGAAEMANGYYLDGTIYVNSRSTNPVTQIIAHELTHSVELANSYEQLSRLVLHRMQETGVNLAEARAKKRELYGRNGVQLDDTAVDQELVAEYVEHHLLTDEESIRNLVAQDRSLGRRILDWLTTLINRLRGRTTAAEQRFLANARSAYARALREAQNNERQHATAEGTLEGVREDYNAGEMSDEEFNEALDVVAEQESLAGINQLDMVRTDDAPAEQYSYGGRGAANADLEALSAAEEMERRDVDAETIRQQTGWFRGRDGKWRFEIDDSGMEYRREGDANLRRESGYQRLTELTGKWEASMSGGEALTESERAEMDRLEEEYGERVYEERYLLSDFIEHSELYDNYPQLRYTSLAFDELPDGTSGYYNYEDGAIHLSNKFIGEPRDVLIHEIQHAIQRYEGFTRGASPEYWARREYESGDLVGERLRRDYDSVFNSLSREEQNKYTRYRELDRALNQTMFAEPGTEEAVAYQRYEAEQDTLYEELYPNEWFRQLLDLERRMENVPGEYARMYRNTAGEIEARDAAARRRLTAEERRATPPDLGDENTVFADDNGGTSWSLGYDAESVSIKEQIENTRDELNSMEPVANAQVPESLTSKSQASRWAINELRRWGGHVDRQGFGNIYFSEKDIDLGVRYADTPAEKAALAVMPQVLKRGIEIGKHDAHKGRDKRTITFAAPVTLNGTRGNMAVVINQRSNHYYAHRIVLPDGTAFVFGKNTEDAARELSRGVAENGSLARTTSAASNGSIREDGENVNSQYSISDPERRRDVMALLRRYVGGDITTAELNTYLNGQTRAVNAETGAAQDIINRAHADGMSVDEFLRYNWDEFETDGQLSEDARQALDLERLGVARRYSIAEPGRVYVAPGNVDVVQNATPDEYRRIRNASYIDYPWLMGTGESPVIRRTDANGNTYHWREDYDYNDAAAVWASEHFGEDIEPQYSISEDVQPQSEDEAEYQRIVEALPSKAKPTLKRAERSLLDAISKALGVPYSAQRNTLEPIVHSMTVEYMNTGHVSEESIDKLFEEAYDAGVVIDREYYDNYKGVLDYLKQHTLKIAPEDYHDIPDFYAFRKSNFGRLRINISDGTTNIDQVYDELATMWPGVFNSDRHTVPSDQLLHIASVAQGIRISEMSLDKALGRDAAQFRKESRREFRAHISETVGKLGEVRRYVEDRNQQRSAHNGVPQSEEEAAALWTDLKGARRGYERVLSRTLLTQADEHIIGQLMRGEMSTDSIQSLDPERYNVKGITEVYAAKRAYEDIAIPLRRWNQQRKARLYEQADMHLQNVDLWKDKKAGALYSRETMERNIRDITPDEETAEAVNSTYFTPVREATAQGNRIKNSYRKRVRELKLSRKVAEGNVVSEAHAVQLLGEAEDNLRVIEQSRGRIRERDGKSREDWRGVIQNLWAHNPKLDEQKIRSAMDEFRRIYDELFEQMNTVRIRNGYEPINYRSGYFPHFQPGNGDGILSQFGRALGIDTQVTALPTSINGLTHLFRPGITWFGNAQERLGFNTAYDAVEGFDRYIEGVTDVITQTDNIQRLRALANRTRYNTTDEGLKNAIDRILNDPNIKEEDKQNRIEKLYETGRYTLSNFVVELEEYTNLLANKKSRRDRDVEQDAGRRIYNIMRAVSGRVAANMVAINPTSWLTNFVPLTQGWAELGSGKLLTGMWQTLQSYVNDDGVIDKSTFLTNRKGSDPIVQVWEQGAEPEGGIKRAVRTAGKIGGKLGDILSSPMELIDMFVSGSLVRAKYLQNLGTGMSEAAAMADADAFAARVIADRSKGAQPTRFGRRNPLAQIFNQFQLEVNNQLSYIFKDVPREMRKAGTAAMAWAMVKFFVGALIFDELYELVFGRRPALDPLGIVNDTLGDLFGWEVPNLIELGWGVASGNMPSFDAEATGLTQAGLNLVENVAEQLPFIGGVLGGGRLPISSALPDIGNLWNAISGDELAPEYRRQEIADELSAPFYYVAMPFGGSIMSRIFDTIKATKEGGQYKYSTEGELQLQYPVYNEDAGDVVGNLLRGGVFGLTTYGPGREWVEEGFTTLSVDQTAAYQGMLDAGVEGETAYDLLQSFREADSAEARRYAISSAEISGDGKSAAYYALLANEDEQALMEELAEAGADMGAATEAIIGVRNAQTLDGAEETEFKLRAIRDAELDQNDKISIYRNMVSKSQDEDIMAFLEAGLSFDAYLDAKAEYARLNEDYEDSGERALAFAEWADGQDISAEQAQIMRDTLAPLSGNMRKLTENGLDLDAASEIDDALENLGEGASSADRYLAIAELPISEAEKDMALEGIMSESAYAKFRRAADAGIDAYDYCSFLEEISYYSGDGRQDRIWAYIDNMPISKAQKDALHLAAGYKESTLEKAPWNR